MELLLPHATRRVATLCPDGMAALLKKVNKPLLASEVSKEAEKAAKKMGPGDDVLLGGAAMEPDPIFQSAEVQGASPSCLGDVWMVFDVRGEAALSSNCCCCCCLGPCIWQHITDSGDALSVPGEVLIQEEDEAALVTSRFPFVRGREHAPKAAAAMILRKLNQRKQQQ